MSPALGVRGVRDAALLARIERFVHADVVLVSSDFDGVLSPLVDDPGMSVGDAHSLAALHALAQLPNTHVAVVSGRSLADLHTFMAPVGTIHLVGSHGAEFDASFERPVLDGITANQREVLMELSARLAIVGAQFAGALVESKPGGVTFHYRMVAEPLQSQAAELARQAGDAYSHEVQLTEGKLVVEYSVTGADKGQALEVVRHFVGAHSVLFIGDDVTDEHGFGVLTDSDVSVKVGDGLSKAQFRVGDVGDVTALLQAVLVARTRVVGPSSAAGG